MLQGTFFQTLTSKWHSELHVKAFFPSRIKSLFLQQFNLEQRNQKYYELKKKNPQQKLCRGKAN